MEKMDHAVEIHDLTKQFGDITAVDHINLQVLKGEIFGFLGPNGAGKTTTIRMLTGVLPPDLGTAVIMGYDILKNPIRVKELISVVPEMANAYVDLTAWQNLMLMGELYGVNKKETCYRADGLLKELGLFKRRNHLVRGFSKGMRQKLILRGLNEVETTVFLTTHNMDEANLLCDRIAIINHGKIAAVDTPENLRMKSSGLKSVEVCFDRSTSIEKLSSFSNVGQVKKIGDKTRLYTETPHQVIDDVMDFARSNGLTIVSLNTLAPSLEDVFLKLINEQEEA
jgi:ABC-2 type transport system ATP-binding protein